MTKSQKRNKRKRDAKRQAQGRPVRQPCVECNKLALQRAPKYDSHPSTSAIFSGYHCPTCGQVWIKLAAQTDSGTTIVQWRKAFVIDKKTGEYKLDD